MASPAASAQAYHQFYWGLSLGITVLALAGFVWFGWAISVFESPAAAAVGGVVDAIVAGCLIWAGRGVRREARGFKRSDLRLGSEEQRTANRRVSVRFRWVVLGEWSGIGLAAFGTYHFGRGDLFPPAMSLVIALHFFPLACLPGDGQRRLHRLLNGASRACYAIGARFPAGSERRRIRRGDVGNCGILRPVFRAAGCGVE